MNNEMDNNERFWAWVVVMFIGYMILVGGFLMAQSVKMNNTLKAIQVQQIEWQNQDTFYAQ